MQNRVRIYVDGLNFFHGVACRYGIKWIDLEGLLRTLVCGIVPNARIERIYLFAAPLARRVNSDDADGYKTYLKALRAHSPCIEWIEGRMQPQRKKGRFIHIEWNDQNGAQRTLLPCIEKAKTVTYEEKETDVKLAGRIVHDAHVAAGKEFDIACLVSNDSDMAYALEIKKALRQRALLIAPRVEHSKVPVANSLKKLVPKADRIATIGKSVVSAHRLPDPVGRWHAPDAAGWR